MRNNKGQFKKGYRNILQWKGDKASYFAKHAWMNNHFGRPQQCENCGTTEKDWYDWANISGKYLRERSDWKRLCRPCHAKMDKKYGEKWHSAKLTEKQVRVIKWALYYGAGIRYLGRAFKVSHRSILDIKNNKQWKHITIS